MEPQVAVITFPQGPHNAEIGSPHGIPAGSQILSIGGVAQVMSGPWAGSAQPIPHADAVSTNVLQVRLDASNCYVKSLGDYRSMECRVAVRYLPPQE